MIASLTHTVEGIKISQLRVLVWGQQRLFPCVTFITGVRLHPVCIRLLWHWILILMEKDYVIFAGTETDYPFWASWKVARVCLQMLSGNNVLEELCQRSQVWTALLTWTFFFTFHLFFLLCELAAFEDLLLQAGAVTWIVVVQALRSLPNNKLFDTLNKNTRRKRWNIIAFLKMQPILTLKILPNILIIYVFSLSDKFGVLQHYI